MTSEEKSDEGTLVLRGQLRTGETVRIAEINLESGHVHVVRGTAQEAALMFWNSLANQLKDRTATKMFLREATDEELFKELERRYAAFLLSVIQLIPVEGEPPTERNLVVSGGLHSMFRELYHALARHIDERQSQKREE